MNRQIFTAAVSALALSVAVSASAQTTKPVGLSVRAGIVFPTNGGGSSNTAFGIGGEFKVADANMGGTGNAGSMGHISLSADYYGKNGSYAIPVLLNYVGSNNEFFYSAGAGVAFTKVDTGAGSDNKSEFGYQFGIGYNFAQASTPVFIEAKYWGNGNSRLNAIGLYLGIRL